jgi:hypothetical protein
MSSLNILVFSIWHCREWYKGSKKTSCITMKTETNFSFETFVLLYQYTNSHFPEEWHFHQRPNALNFIMNFVKTMEKGTRGLEVLLKRPLYIMDNIQSNYGLFEQCYKVVKFANCLIKFETECTKCSPHIGLLICTCQSALPPRVL